MKLKVVYPATYIEKSQIPDFGLGYEFDFAFEVGKQYFISINNKGSKHCSKLLTATNEVNGEISNNVFIGNLALMFPPSDFPGIEDNGEAFLIIVAWDGSFSALVGDYSDGIDICVYQSTPSEPYTGGGKVIFPETTVQCNTDGNELSGPGFFTIDERLEAHNEYVFIIDGVPYHTASIRYSDTLESVVDSDIIVAGNIGIVDPGYPNTGDPFMAMAVRDQDGILIAYKINESDPPRTCTIGIESTGYTSEQYKYLLFQRLRRHLAMKNAADRAYTQSFFGKLFEGITITTEAYNNFVKIMDDNIAYCAENNVKTCENITSTMINERGVLLIEAFAAIGIGLEIVPGTFDNAKGTATFTKPNGEVMVYEVEGFTSRNYFYIYSKSQTEYQYAKLSAPYYNFTDKPPVALVAYNPMSAGPGTYWKYVAESYEMTITGDGTYVGAPTDPQVGAGPYTTLIIGSAVSKLGTGVLNNTIGKLVLLHAADAPINLDSGMVASGTWTMDVYCDNETFRNYAFPSNLTINWHTLAEWDGNSHG